MREPTPVQSIRLTDQQTLHDTMIIARRHIPLTANGYRCQTDDLWRLLLASAARRTTIETACADLSGAPDANTVRGYLTEQLPPSGIPDLEQQWNSLLRTLLPDWLRERPQELAVDFHDEPYYGRDQADDPDNWVCRGEARAGTTRFYRCATAYLIETISKWGLQPVARHRRQFRSGSGHQHHATIRCVLAKKRSTPIS